jgi:hypothetical protein
MKRVFRLAVLLAICTTVAATTGCGLFQRNKQPSYRESFDGCGDGCGCHSNSPQRTLGGVI